MNIQMKWYCYLWDHLLFGCPLMVLKIPRYLLKILTLLQDGQTDRNSFEILKMVCYVTSSFSVIENDDIDDAIVILSLLFLEKYEEGPAFKCLPQVNVSSSQKVSKQKQTKN